MQEETREFIYRVMMSGTTFFLPIRQDSCLISCIQEQDASISKVLTQITKIFELRNNSWKSSKAVSKRSCIYRCLQYQPLLALTNVRLNFESYKKLNRISKVCGLSRPVRLQNVMTKPLQILTPLIA